MVPDTVQTDMHLRGEPEVHTAQDLATLIDQQIATDHLDVRRDLSRLGLCGSPDCAGSGRAQFPADDAASPAGTSRSWVGASPTT